jgi:hypothetical protein
MTEERKPGTADDAQLFKLIDAELHITPPSSQVLARAASPVLTRLALRIAVPFAVVTVGLVALLTSAAIMPLTPARGVGFALLAASGVALTWLAAAGRVRAALLGTFVASLAFAIGSARTDSLTLQGGPNCILAALIPTLFGLGAVALANFRGRPLRGDRWRAVALLASGLLIGQAGQIVSCGARENLIHGLVFHSGGVIVLTALLALLLRPWRSTSPALRA